MEMKTGSGSPRDRIDDELLVKLLGESERDIGQYGNLYGAKRCGCRRAQMNINPPVTYMPRREENAPADNKNDCGCNDEDCAKKNCLSGYPLAMSYTPDQEWRSLFDIEEALSHGTIFCELEFTFYPGCRSCK